MENFVGELTTGMSAGNIWGAIAPIAGLIVVVTLVAIGRRLINKNTNSIKTGKSGRA